MLFEKPVFFAVTLTGAGAGFGSSFFSSSAARATMPRHARPTIFPVLRFFGGWGCGKGGLAVGLLSVGDRRVRQPVRQVAERWLMSQSRAAAPPLRTEMCPAPGSNRSSAVGQ